MLSQSSKAMSQFSLLQTCNTERSHDSLLPTLVISSCTVSSWLCGVWPPVPVLHPSVRFLFSVSSPSQSRAHTMQSRFLNLEQVPLSKAYVLCTGTGHALILKQAQHICFMAMLQMGQQGTLVMLVLSNVR